MRERAERTDQWAYKPTATITLAEPLTVDPIDMVDHHLIMLIMTVKNQVHRYSSGELGTDMWMMADNLHLSHAFHVPT